MEKLKTQFYRWLFIDRKISSGSYPNCNTLADEWEVDSRTIQRDINYLKEWLDAPIEYDYKKRGYYYSQKNYRIPAITILEKDLFAIFIAEKVLQQYENTPIYSKLVSIFTKIEKYLPDKVSINPSWIENKFSFFNEPASFIEPKIWETIFEALKDKNILSFLYKTPYHTESVERAFNIYHVAAYKGDWYTVGYCHYNKEIRIYNISRIQQVKIKNEKYTIPDNFNIEDHINKQFGFFMSSKEYGIKIKFTPDIAPYIKERIWHDTQTIKENKDKSIVLSFKTKSLVEVKRWVLSWGKGAKVMGPKELVDLVKKELEESFRIYE